MPSGRATRCFLHIPKSAGMSVHAALEAAFPAGSVAPARFDDSVFCGFSDFDALRPEQRRRLVADDAEVAALAGYSIVSGHFHLPTLTAVAPPSAIATVLREPRARLLSLYAYWRALTFEEWRPYDVHKSAHRPLAEFLADPAIAPAIDNKACRLVLGSHPRVPRDAFIDPADAEGLGQEAVARLGELAFVGLQELPRAMWRGLSAAFGVPLPPVRTNATGPRSKPDVPPPEEGWLTAESLELLDRRTAVDRLVHAHFAEAACDDAAAAARLADVAFARQLFRLGDIASGDAMRDLEARLAAAEHAAAAAAQELSALRATRRYRVGAALARPLDRLRRARAGDAR